MGTCVKFSVENTNKHQKNKILIYGICGCHTKIILKSDVESSNFSFEIPSHFEYYYIVINNELLSFFTLQKRKILINEQTTIAGIFLFHTIYTNRHY